MDDPRQCPICGGADQHATGCALEGKEHVRIQRAFGLEDIDWTATLELHGLRAEHPAVFICPRL